MKKLKEMDKKKKIYLGVLVISLITLIAGVSYAYIAYTAKQTSTNIIGTSCVKVTLSDVTSAINLDKAYPLKDSEAEQLTPYKFKIENNCDTPVTYKVDLDVLNTDKPTPLYDLAIKVDNNNKQKLSTLLDTENKIEEAYVSKELLTGGILNVGSSIEHSIKLWLDETATNDSQNTMHNSKVVVTATQDTSLDIKNVMSSFMNETVYLTYKTFGSVADVTCKYGLSEDNLNLEGSNITETSCELNPTVSNTNYYYEVCLQTKEGIKRCEKGVANTDLAEIIINETIKSKDNITIPIETSGKNITCKYSTKENTYTIDGEIENNSCKIFPIEGGKTYYYQICSTNEQGNTGCVTGSEKTEVPTLEIESVTSTDNSISINYKATGTELTTTCKYGTNPNNITSEGTVNGNTCTLEGLSKGTNYYYEVSTTNVYGATVTKGGSRVAEIPTLAINNVTQTDNSITINYTATGTNLTTTCKYGTSPTSLTSTGTISGSTCTLNGLSKGTTYYYEISTTNKNGDKVIKTGNRVAEIPTLAINNVTPTDNSITINYTATGTNLTTTCKYGTSANNLTSTGTVNGSTCTLSGLTKGTTYYYEVSITNKNGTKISKTGNKVAEIPTLSISATATTNKITININAAGTGLTTTCKYGTNEKDMSLNGSVSGNTCTLSNLDVGTTYYYTVSITNKNGSTVTRTSKTTTYELPTLSIKDATSTTSSITVPFTAKGYNVTTSCTYGIEPGSYKWNGTVSGNSCVYTGLAEGTDYYYEVIVVDGDSHSTSAIGHEYTKTKFFEDSNIGDYVAYTPSMTSYDISNELTGMNNCSGPYCATTATTIKKAGKQTINPSELNLWRVIKKNDDGTIEIVSEKISTNKIYFYGNEGYRRFVGTLNTIASAYETSGITVGSRHVGGTDEQATCSSYDMCGDQNTGENPYCNRRELNLIADAIGTIAAENVKNNARITQYWIASRYARPPGYNTPYTRYYGLIVNTDGGVGVIDLDGYLSSNDIEKSVSAALRPIVTLKSGLTATEGIRNSKKLWTVN